MGAPGQVVFQNTNQMVFPNVTGDLTELQNAAAGAYEGTLKSTDEELGRPTTWANIRRGNLQKGPLN